MNGRHLGTRASALVDGELPDDVRDRALAHLTVCRPCRDLVEAERGMRALVRALDGPAISASLVASLTFMAEPGGPVPPRDRAVPGSPRTPTARLRPPARPVPRAPAGGPGRTASRGASSRTPRARSLRARRSVVFAVGTLVVAGLGVAGLATLGAGAVGARTPTPRVVTPVDLLTVNPSGSVRDWPALEPASRPPQFGFFPASLGGGR